MDYKKTVLAFAVVAVMLISGLPMAASETDADVSSEEYGTTFGIDLDRIDAVLKEITGETLKEIVEDLAKLADLDLTFSPMIDSKFALTRDVYTEENYVEIVDRLGGYIVIDVDSKASGLFPKAGTYEVAEGESSDDFLKRVFVDNRTEQHTVSITATIGITIEADVITRINLDTGEMEEAYIAIFPLVSIDMSSDINFTDKEDDEGNIESLAIDYNGSEFKSNVYGNFQIHFDIEDMKVLGDGEWTVKPTITQSVTRSVVSTDLVNEIWPFIKDMIGSEGKISGAIPELIRSILTSTDRKLDVFKTIESLTNSKVHDMIFTGDITVSNDEDGNILMKIKRNSTTVDISYPTGEYSLEAGKIIDLIPDDILSEDAKIIAKIALGILGWDSLDVVDITHDEEKKNECHEIQDMVREINKENESYETTIPVVYIVITIVVILAACGVTVLMWRGKI